jgi:hypothetical protein
MLLLVLEKNQKKRLLYTQQFRNGTEVFYFFLLFLPPSPSSKKRHQRQHTVPSVQHKTHWCSFGMDNDDIDLLDENFEGDGDEEEGVTYKEVEIREQDR